MRDSQRNKVYNSERTLELYFETSATIEASQRTVDDALKSRWFRKRWPGISANGIVVSSAHTHLKNTACGRFKKEALFVMLEMPPAGRNLLRTFHELAHVCASSDTHGREWASIYLLLVRRFIGHVTAKKLVVTFKKNRVHWHAKRRMSEEARQRLRERFELIRRKRHGVQSAEGSVPQGVELAPGGGAGEDNDTDLGKRQD